LASCGLTRFLLRIFADGAKLFIHLIIFTVVRYIMSTLLVTCPLPGGPYTPFLVIGAGFGRLYAETLVAWFPEWGLDVQTNAYPLVAAAALTAGATHQRFSSAVLVLEITGVTMMFPLLICVTISSWIANQLWVPLADSIIRVRSKLPVRAEPITNLR
jgi:H+/Cl- antiporter ClcA